MVISGTHRSIESGLLSDRVLLLIEELPGRSIDVDVALGTDVLIALHAAVFSFPAELLGIFGMKLSIQRCIVPLVLYGCEDVLAGRRAGLIRWMNRFLLVLGHLLFLSLLLCWLWSVAEVDGRSFGCIVAEALTEVFSVVGVNLCVV